MRWFRTARARAALWAHERLIHLGAIALQWWLRRYDPKATVAVLPGGVALAPYRCTLDALEVMQRTKDPQRAFKLLALLAALGLLEMK